MRLLNSEGINDFAPVGLLGGHDNSPGSRLLNKGLTHHLVGRWRQAEIYYRSFLQQHPRHPEALHLLAVILHQRGKSAKAVDLLETAMKVCPNEPRFYLSYGESQRALHQYDIAVACYQRSLALDPDFAPAFHNLGLALQDLGRSEDAVICYHKALVLAPALAEGHNNLGVALDGLGRVEEAIASFQQALAIDPYLASAHSNLGICVGRLGMPIEAIVHHQTAMRLGPDEVRYRIAFVTSLSGLPISRANEALKQDLIETLAFDGVDHQYVAFASASIIKHSPPFQNLLAFVQDAGDGASFQDLFEAGLRELSADRLFLACLKKTIFRDAQIERVLTRTRQTLLQMVVEEPQPGAMENAQFPLVCALARQCFLNEYVYGVAEEEVSELRKLQQMLVSDDMGLNACRKTLFAVSACYNPLNCLEQDRTPIAWLESGSDDDWLELITQQIVEPGEEARLKGGIETIGTIDDSVSQTVRAQYEDNPYPRWLSAQRVNGEPIPRLIKRLFPHFPLQRIPDRPAPDILVAGCGTGQQAVDRSLGIASSKVVGVDLSYSSLSYAKRKAAELKITNVEFIHADILELRLLNRSFDIIECIGVLHHMNNLEEGWRALADVLRPGGMMRIGLYSKAARNEIAAAQSYVAEKNYPVTSDGIRTCRQDFFKISDGSNLRNVTKIVDFYTLSETRDLLFHVHEKRYTLPEIAETIKKLNLTFVGFEFKDRSEINRYLKHFSDDPTATSLSRWSEYEQQNTNAFVGLYILWVQKPG
jgi:tetratricopeptide (TPR) repeat protein/ubiquinone/menaquinone biosynthesis C-methylase UbiE